jgi:hypothetical protein
LQDITLKIDQFSVREVLAYFCLFGFH